MASTLSTSLSATVTKIRGGSTIQWVGLPAREYYRIDIDVNQITDPTKGFVLSWTCEGDSSWEVHHKEPFEGHIIWKNSEGTKIHTQKLDLPI